MDTSRAALSFSGFLADGRNLVVLILFPRALLTAGRHPFHSFETFGLVANTSTSFETLGTIGDGELRFDRAGIEDGADIAGSFEAIHYQSACLGAAPSDGSSED
jgi:hypothetical protein